MSDLSISATETRAVTQGGRRTLILAGIGATIGLIVAGFGLFTATGTSTLVVPAEDVALVNQQPLSRLDFIAALQSSYAITLADATPEQRRAVLEDMIREEVFVQRGRELDVASVDPDVRAAIVRSVEEQAAAPAALENPPDAKLRAYFDAHRDLYATEGRMIPRDLVFADATSAAAALAALRPGEESPAAVLAASGGRDSGKVEGEEFYFAAKIHLGAALFEAARLLPSGGVSAPIAADGVHVLVMLRNTPPVPLPYDAVRGRVLDDYRRDAINRLQAREAAFLRKRANILLAPDLR